MRVARRVTLLRGDAVVSPDSLDTMSDLSTGRRRPLSGYFCSAEMLGCGNVSVSATGRGGAALQ